MDKPNIDYQKKFYDNYWNNKGYLNRLKLLRAIKILQYLSYIKTKIKEPEIIDFGCGDGRFTAFIGEFGNTSGVELSEETVNRSNLKYPWVKFLQGDCISMEVPKEKYDIVISQEVIEHVWEQDVYLRQCHKMLKPGGYIILTTPNKRILNLMKTSNWSNQPIENIITFQKIKHIINKSNFKIIKSETIIFNYGDKGLLKIVNSKYLIGFLDKIGLTWIREIVLSKLGLGLHSAILAQKINNHTNPE